MLTKVTAYSPLSGVAPLVFNIVDTPDTDLFVVRNIDGLEAVKADVNTSPYAIVDGESYLGSSIGKRNLVFTIGLIPDWDEWNPTKLRRKLDLYFMPKMNTTLIFEGDEQPPVVIAGYVESNDPSIFSKDVEHQVSIICPQPDFIAVDPIVVTGDSTAAVPIIYEGTKETGMLIEAVRASGSTPTVVQVETTVVLPSSPKVFKVHTAVDATKKFVMSSVRKQKYVHSVTIPGGVITDIFGSIDDAFSSWPTLEPGSPDGGQTFRVNSDAGVQNWTLTYYPRFGSL